MKKRLAILMTALLPCGSIVAQSLKISKTDGEVLEYQLSEIDSITFASEPMEENLWDGAQVSTRFYYAPNWNQLSDPSCTYSDESYVVRLTQATFQQWQAQMFLETNLSTAEGKYYDFSVTLESSKDVNDATVKLYQKGNDNSYYFTERIDLTANAPYEFRMRGMKGINMNPVSLVLDFGGNAANTVVKVSGLSLIEYDEMPDTTPVNLDEYNLVWYDEFNGSSLMTSKWTYEQANPGWVNNELQYYVSGRTPKGTRVAEVSEGTLKIRAVKENNNVYSARIYGRKQLGFKYCYIEACIKLPQGKGTWPAFWMMPVNFTSWPADGEIDIMEEVGADAGKVSSSIHCSAYNHANKTQKTHEMDVSTAETDFHIYSMEWTPDYIRTYVDGNPQLTFLNDGKGDKATWPFNQAFYPILNLAWGGDWGGYAGVDESALPATLEVDYVRVYQK